LALKSFQHPGRVSERQLFDAVGVFGECRRGKAFIPGLSVGDTEFFLGLESVVVMAYSTKTGDVGYARCMAREASRHMARKLSLRPEYRGIAHPGFVIEAAHKDQLRQALLVVADRDAWDVELEV